MVVGDFGVFDHTELLAEFGDDESADEYRRDALELDVPEGFRCSPYDDLEVREITEEDRINMRRVVDGLRTLDERGRDDSA
jgi:hypothetical protein